jgi:hypothetical protein
VIGGENGAGKSSVLDAIEDLFGGEKHALEKPIHEGKERSEIVAKLDDLVVKKVRTAKGAYLSVTTADGIKAANPQEVLDRLTGKLTFDPMTFLNSDDKGKILRQLAGLDFTTLTAQIKERAERRTAVNRDVKKYQAQFDGSAFHPDMPAGEVSISDLSGQVSAAVARNQVIAKRWEAAREMESMLARFDERAAKDRALVEEYQKQIRECEKKITEANVRLSSHVAAKLEASNQHTEALKVAQSEPVIDLKPLHAKVAEADGLNQKVRANAQRAAYKLALDVAKTESEALTNEIEALEKTIETRISEAKYPLDGLSVSPDGTVLFNKLPLSQASTRDQLLISAAIGAALNPKLRVLLIRRGNDLDSKGLKALAEWADAQQVQIWLERVAENEKVSVRIEDGHAA